jgi:hypothetical protein
VPARQAGARPRTVPARQPRTPRAAVPVRRPPMAPARVPRGTRAVVVRRRAQLTGPAGRHAQPPKTDREGTAGPPRAGSTGAAGPLPAAGPPRAGSTGAAGLLPAAGPPRAGSTGAAGPLPAPGPPRAGSIAAAPGPRTTAEFVLPLAVRPAKAPVAGPHRAAGLTGRPREASAGTPRRVANSAPPGGQPTPGHGGPRRVMPGEARGPQVAPKGAGEIPTGRARGPQAKGRPRVMAAVTGHRGPLGAGPATAAQATAAQAPGTRHGQAAGARTRPQPAVTQRPMRPGRMFLIRSAPSSSTPKRGLS